MLCELCGGQVSISSGINQYTMVSQGANTDCHVCYKFQFVKEIHTSWYCIYTAFREQSLTDIFPSRFGCFRFMSLWTILIAPVSLIPLLTTDLSWGSKEYIFSFMWESWVMRLKAYMNKVAYWDWCDYFNWEVSGSDFSHLMEENERILSVVYYDFNLQLTASHITFERTKFPQLCFTSQVKISQVTEMKKANQKWNVLFFSVPYSATDELQSFGKLLTSWHCHICLSWMYSWWPVLEYGWKHWMLPTQRLK